MLIYIYFGSSIVGVAAARVVCIERVRTCVSAVRVRACVSVCVRVRVGVRARAVRLRARVYDQACEQHVHGFTDKSMAR